jgi:hypothetical protein
MGDYLQIPLLALFHLNSGTSFARKFRFSFDFCKVLVYLGFEDIKKCLRE